MPIAAQPIARWRRPLVAALLVVTAAASSPLLAQAPPESPWSAVVYLQQSFPKQTRTNDQIQQINRAFGANFDDWSDVANLSLGAQLYRRVSPLWRLGVEVDWSRGSIDGKTTIPTEAGPARLAFEQKYDVYANLMAVAHFEPCRRCVRAIPFVYMGAGFGYEKDTTTLTLRNDYLDEGLKVDNDGTFPVGSVGLGVDFDLGARRNWYLEVGGAYYWGRLNHTVAASGSLAPAPRVRADNDSTGPNYWLGVGWRF